MTQPAGQPNKGRPEAAAAIWSPTPEDAGARDAARRRQARRQGLLQAALGAGFAGRLIWLWSPGLAGVVLGVSTVILLAALLSPLRAYAGIERGFAALGHWTGEALTWVAMVGLFYLFFVPFGLLFRRGRRDPLKRWTAPDEASYWEEREPARDGVQLRQY